MKLKMNVLICKLCTMCIVLAVALLVLTNDHHQSASRYVSASSIKAKNTAASGTSDADRTLEKERKLKEYAEMEKNGKEFNWEDAMKDIDVNLDEDGKPTMHILGEGKKLFEHKLLKRINQQIKAKQGERLQKKPVGEFLRSTGNRHTADATIDPLKNTNKNNGKASNSNSQQGTNFAFRSRPVVAPDQSMNPDETVRRMLNTPSPDFVELNDYFLGTTYGDEPGPCPNYAERCIGEAQNLQDWILDMELDLPIVGTRKIREIVIHDDPNLPGYTSIWDLSCWDLAIVDIKIILQDPPNYNDVVGEHTATVDLEVHNLELECTGEIEFEELGLQDLKGDPCLILPPVKVGNPVYGDFEFDISKDGNGITLKARTKWQTETPLTEKFNKHLPYEFNFHEHPDGGNDGDGGCRLDPWEFGLEMPSGSFTMQQQSTYFFCTGSSDGTVSISWGEDGLDDWLIGIVIGIVVSLVRSFLAGIICDLVKQLAYLDNDINRPGGINLAIQDLHETLNGYRDAGKRGRTEFEQREGEILNELDDELSDAVDFSTNSLFESASVGLNEILGSESDSEGYEGILVINEIIDQALGSRTGEQDLGDLVEDDLKLEEYPRWDFANPVFEGYIEARTLRLGGLNTFTKFEFLDNGFGIGEYEYEDFEKYKHVLINNFAMDNFELETSFDVLLWDGEWVTNRGPSNRRYFPINEEPLRFSLTVGLEEFTIDTAIFLGFIFDEFISLKIGWLFGYEQDYRVRAQCLFTAIEWLEVVGLFTGFINREDEDPQLKFSLTNNGQVLQSLIEDSFNFGNSVYRSAVEEFSPYIAEHFIRPEFNGFLDRTVFNPPPEDKFRHCDDNEPIPLFPVINEGDQYINLGQSRIFDAVSATVRNVVGGDPVADTSGEINRVIDEYLQYYNKEAKEEREFERIEFGEWRYIPISDQGIFHIEANDNYFTVQNMSLIGVNSINKFLLENDGSAFEADISLRAGGGKLACPSVYDDQPDDSLCNAERPERDRDEIGAVVDFDVKVVVDGSEYEGPDPDTYADDLFQVFLTFANVTADVDLMAKVNKNKGLELRFEQLAELTCFLAIVDETEIQDITMGLLGGFTLQVKWFDESDRNTSATTNFGKALAEVNAEFGGESSKVAVQNFVYFFQGVAEDLKEEYNNFDIDYEIDGCENAGSPFGASLGGRLFQVVVDTSNFTDIYEGITNFNPDRPTEGATTESEKDTVAAEAEQDIQFEGEEDKAWKVADDPLVQEISDLLSGAQNAKDVLNWAVDQDWEEMTEDIDFDELGDEGVVAFAYGVLAFMQGLYRDESDNIGTTVKAEDLNKIIAIFPEPYEDDRIAPDLRVSFGNVTIEPLNKVVAFELLSPYGGDFTLKHLLKWTDPMIIRLDAHLEVNEAFVLDKEQYPAVDLTRILEEKITFEVELDDLEISLLTVSAINSEIALETLMGNYLERDECLGRMFYLNGLSVHEFWVSTNQLNPTITTTMIEDRITQAGQYSPDSVPEILSPPIVHLVEAVIELFSVILWSDVHKVTQGYLRDLINSELSDYVIVARELEICPPVRQWDPPYLDYTSSIPSAVLTIFNGEVGGAPVKEGAPGINTVLQEFLVFVDENYFDDITLINDNNGEWGLPEIFEYRADVEGADDTKILITNLLTPDIQLIHYFTIDEVDHETLDIAFKIGGGALEDREGGSAIELDDFEIQFTFDALINIENPTGVENFGDDKYTIRFLFNNLTIVTESEILLNLNTLYERRLGEMNSTRCLAVLFDKVHPNTLDIDFAEWKVVLENKTRPSNVTGIPNLSRAFYTLQAEALEDNDAPEHMLRRLLRGVSSVLTDVAKESFPQEYPAEHCSVPGVRFAVIRGLNTATEEKALQEAIEAEVDDVIPGDNIVFTTDDDDRYISVYVQSDRVTTDRKDFIKDVVEAADGVSITLKESSACSGTFLGGTALEQPCSWLVDNSGDFTAVYEQWSKPQTNLIDEDVAVTQIEESVTFEPDDPFYDVQRSAIARSVSNYFASSLENFRDLIRESHNITEILELEDDGSVSLVLDVRELIEMADDFAFNSTNCTPEEQPFSFSLSELLLQESSTFIPRFSFHPGELRFRNFDRFTDIVFLRPYQNGRFTTEHGLFYDNETVHLIFDGEFWADKSFKVGGEETGDILKEKFNVTISFEDLRFQMLTLLAVNTTSLGKISLGNFLDADKQYHDVWLGQGGEDVPVPDPAQVFTQNCFAANCLMTSIFPFGAQIPQLTLNVTDVIGPKFEIESYEFFTPGVEQFVNALMEIGVQLVKFDLPNIFQGPIREYLQDEIYGIVSDAKKPGACPEMFNYTTDYPEEISILNFAENPQLIRFRDYINDVLLDPDSVLYINRLIGTLIGDLESEYTEYNNIPIEYDGNSYGSASVGFGRFTLTNLDQVEELQIFNPTPYLPGGSEYTDKEPESRRRLRVPQNTNTQQYMSRTQVLIAAGKDPEEIEIGFEFHYEFQGLFVGRGDESVRNHISVRLRFTEVDILADLFMLVNIPRLMEMEIQSVSSVSQLPCILAIFEEQGLTPMKFNLTYGSVGFTIACESRCDAPMLSPLERGAITEDSSEGLAQDFKKAITDGTNAIIQFMDSSTLQDAVDNRIRSAAEDCEAVRLGNPPRGQGLKEQNVAVFMGIAGLGALCCTGMAFAALVPMHFRKKDDMMKAAILESKSKSKDEFELAERRLASQWTHAAVPFRQKLVILSLLITALIFFITANFFAVGADVEVVISIAGDTTRPLVLLPFGLENSINDMATSGAWWLAVIIFLASGLWPYTKLIMLGFALFAPITVLKYDTRTKMLAWLDFLGQWSLVDASIVILLQVAFRIYLESSFLEAIGVGIPTDFLTVDVSVTPRWGTYGFLLAAMISVVVNHIQIYWHRESKESDDNLEDAINGTLVTDLRTPRIPLWKHRFNIIDNQGRAYRLSVASRTITLIMLFLTAIFVLAGAFVPIITFEFQGLAGIAVSLLGDSNKREFSMSDMYSSLLDGAQGRAVNTIGIVFLQFLFYCITIVFPVLLTIMIASLFAAPLTLVEQRRLYFACEMAISWEAYLIFTIAVVATVYQIRILASFIVENATGGLCRALEEPLENFFPVGSDDAQCFNVKSTLPDTAFVTIFAAALLMVTSSLSIKLAQSAIEDRFAAMKRKTPPNPGEIGGVRGFLLRRSLEPFSRPTAQAPTNQQIQQQGMVASHGLASSTPMQAVSGQQVSGISGVSNGMSNGNGAAGAPPIPSRNGEDSKQMPPGPSIDV